MSLLMFLSRQLLHPQRPDMPVRSDLGMTVERKTSEQGLSLLECVMAIAVIGLTAAMIAPPLFIAAATRVQNRRAEQAFQLAQGEVDRIQVLVSRGDHYRNVLPPISNAPVSGNTVNLSNTSNPSSIPTNILDSVNPSCNTYREQVLTLAQVRPIDVDGDCQADFYLQSFTTAGVVSNAETTAGGTRPTRFQLGVRVYSFLAKDRITGGGLSPNQASLILTSGNGSQRSNPLAVVYSDMRWAERSSTACDYFTNTGDCF
jgi:type II secretory pathway pseudopilin PulG